MSSHKKNNITDTDMNKIREFLETIQYGSVTVIVQDGKIIQIEKNEKVRLK
ncbi:YezD family protein [Anaerosporobacter sp.]